MTYIGYIIGALGIVAGAWMTNRATRKVAQTSVDATAYVRASRITDGLVTQLRKEVERVNHELADTRAQMRRTDESNRRLEGYVRTLIGLLQEHEIPVPTMPRGG